MSCLNLQETDDQLVARYLSGLKMSIYDEIMLYHHKNLEECYQMALKAEEKLKRASMRRIMKTPSIEISKEKSETVRSSTQSTSLEKKEFQ